MTTIGIDWLPWTSLRGCQRSGHVPAQPGLYRIRRTGRDDLDYIGQTGMGTMTLRKRMSMLMGVYAPEMPYRDPHTAAPGLWALRHATQADFEVSAAAVEGTTPWRKGLECVAIARYREEHGMSPTISFGRMPGGYRMSSGNSARLVAAGKRYRGGPTSERDESHLPGIAPPGSLQGPCTGPTWHGLTWSAWQPAGTVTNEGHGIYRIRAAGAPNLLYVGEGVITSRIRAHLKKISQPDHPQGRLLGSAGPLEASFVRQDAWHRNQRLEIENDLIAAHVLEHHAQPAAQFLG